MRSFGRILRFALPLVAALAAWGLWLGEVFLLEDGRLAPFPWSALPISLLIAGVASDVVAARLRPAFVAAAFALVLGAFLLARSELWPIFAISLGPTRSFDLGACLGVALAGLVVSGGLAAAATRWLAPLRRSTFALLALALAAVLPLTAATTAIFPAADMHPSDARAIAFGYSDYWFVHAVRLGYPVFWTTLLLPLALRLGRRVKVAAR